MGLSVLKFGGTSVATPELITAVAARVAAVHRSGRRVVVVVSAMGHTTDELVRLGDAVNPTPPRREVDMLLSSGEQVSIALLAMALHSLNVPAVSHTGPQIGIQTTESHTRARIRSIDTTRLLRELDAGQVVVVAGFQGVTDDGQITTLGRGGSDTTAVALAAALAADSCEIFTDVDGVYTADPRLVPEARKLDRITYDEMLELAVLGAGVMHSRAVQFGQRYRVSIHVRHSRKSDAGTLITEENPDMENASVVGCALKENLGRVSLRDLPNKPGVDAAVFVALSQADINVDDIIQNEASNNGMNMSFTVEHRDLADIKPAMERVLAELGRGELSIDVGLSRVSVVGLGMRSHTGVAAKMFVALADAGINIFNITTSEIKISCIINRNEGERAIKAVHSAFGLAGGQQPSVDTLTPVAATRRAAASTGG